MEYHEITKTQFRDEYNVVKVLTDKLEIMEQLKTYNSKNQAVAFGIRKKKQKVTLEDVILRLDNIDKRLDNIETRLDNIETRLDKHDEMFREHGWMK